MTYHPRLEDSVRRLAGQYEACIRELGVLIEEVRGTEEVRPTDKININGTYRNLSRSSGIDAESIGIVVAELRRSIERNYTAMPEVKDLIEKVIAQVNLTARAKICRENTPQR